MWNNFFACDRRGGVAETSEKVSAEENGKQAQADGCSCCCVTQDYFFFVPSVMSRALFFACPSFRSYPLTETLEQFHGDAVFFLGDRTPLAKYFFRLVEF